MTLRLAATALALGPRLSDAEAAARLQALIAELAAEIGGFGIDYKDESRLHRWIGALLRPLNSRYLQDYTTVFRGRIAFPSRAWATNAGPAALYEIVRHEAVHLRDARRFPVLFELSYLLLPLPVVFTARALWEWRGYRASMAARMELGLPVDEAWIEAVVARFVGADYAFMAPFPGLMRRQLRGLRATLLADGARDAARYGHGGS